MKRLVNLLAPVVALVLAACSLPADIVDNNVNAAVTAKNTSDTTSEKECEIHFIDVGQGDSTLILSEGHAMLVDAGDNNCGTLIRNYLKKHGVEKLDCLVLTHPDADHIGGAASVIENIPIDTVYMPDKKHDSKIYEKTMDALDYMRLTPVMPEPGSNMILGDSNVTFYGPITLSEDNNNCSIITKITVGSKSVLLIGDAEEAELHEVTEKYGSLLSSDIYKAGHHGSYNSSTQEFLDVVDPEYAVISCGEGNDYGHPHADTMNRLRSMGVHIWRTDIQGSIIVKLSDSDISYDTSPCDDYTSGDGIIKSDRETDITETPSQEAADHLDGNYVLNENSKKFHLPDCEAVEKMSEKNKKATNMTREDIIKNGYSPCGICNP